MSGRVVHTLRAGFCVGFLCSIMHTPVFAQASGTAGRIIVEAQVDGPATLHVTRRGIYWVNGNNAKPGLHKATKESTWIDGKPWNPVWDDGGKPRGAAKSDVYALPLDPSRLQFQLLAIGNVRGATGIQKRTAAVVKMEGDELTILIPDPERDSRWYAFALVPHNGAAPFPLVLAPEGSPLLPPGSASTPKPTPAPSLDAGEFVKTNRGSFVFVKGADGPGSGFIVRMSGVNYLMTNARVAASSRGAVFKTMDDTPVQPGIPAIAIGHDICRAPVTFAGKPLEALERVNENAAIGDDVLVLGDAEGAGVIETIKGRISRFDKNVIEVDARFEEGNSGGPIVHLKTGKVIGVAALETQRRLNNPGRDPEKPPVVRRVGYRLDTATIYQPVKWDLLFAQAADMAAVSKLTDDLADVTQELAKNRRVASGGSPACAAVRNRIDTWMQSRSKRLSPQDAALAEQGLLTFIKNTSQADIAAARPRLTFDFLERELDEQQKDRAAILDIFERAIHAL